MENIQTKRFSQLRQSLRTSELWMQLLMEGYHLASWLRSSAGRELEKLFSCISPLLCPTTTGITPGSLPWRLVRKKLAAVLICSSDVMTPGLAENMLMDSRPFKAACTRLKHAEADLRSLIRLLTFVHQKRYSPYSNLTVEKDGRLTYSTSTTPTLWKQDVISKITTNLEKFIDGLDASPRNLPHLSGQLLKLSEDHSASDGWIWEISL